MSTAIASNPHPHGNRPPPPPGTTNQPPPVSAAAAAAAATVTIHLSTTEELHNWLSSWPQVKAQLKMIVVGLQRRQLCGAHPCAKATIEVLRFMLGTCKFQSTFHMMNAVRAVARELHSAAPSELTVGNMARRVLYMIREEYLQKIRQQGIDPTVGQPSSSSGGNSSSNSSGTSSSISGQGGAPQGNAVGGVTAGTGKVTITPLSLPPAGCTALTPGMPLTPSSSTNNMDQLLLLDRLSSLPMPLSPDGTGGSGGRQATQGAGSSSINNRSSSSSSSSSSGGKGTAAGGRAKGTVPSSTSSSVSGAVAAGSMSVREIARQQEEQYFRLSFPDLKQAIMAAIIEFNDELDNVYGPICEQAQEHIHNDECVLVSGHSSTLELFLKAAAKKRRYQVIVVEAAPSLDGHKMALSLSRLQGLAAGNVSVTLIPDSGVYAIMSRVNKVLVCPQAVIADGGAICSCGHLMVATAAKEFSVPVVGVTGAFMLTPLFAHSQGCNALTQLLSPSTVLPYHADVAFENVEVIAPAFDFLPPDLMDLYVTNNGSHQPYYMYRLLAESYHPSDHVI